MREEYDVAVIGGGLSGLTCCYHLFKTCSDLKVAVFEANDRLGGRLQQAELPVLDGTDDWDLGGHWVSSSQHNVMNLIKEFGLSTRPQFVEGRKKIALHSLENISTYSGLIPSIGIFELIDMDRTLKKMESMANKVDPDNPIKCPNAAAWDKITVQTFADQNFMFETSKELFACTLRVVFGCEPSQLSLFYILYYCSLAGGFRFLVDQIDGAAQEFQLNGTTYQLIEKLKDRITSAKIMLGCPVVSIDQSNNDFATLTTKQGDTYKAKHIICTSPPHLVNRIHFNPPLPYERSQLSMRMPMGHLIKCTLTYKSAFWKENGDSGETAFVVPSKSVGPLSVTFDATSHRGNPALVAFIGGEHAAYWTNKSVDERKEAVVKCLVSLLGEESRTELIHYIDKDWSKEEYIGGAPVGIMQPGCLMYFHQALWIPFIRVHWGGTETARRWVGYLDGAVESGVRAADEVLDRIKGNPMQRSVATSSIYSSNLPWGKVGQPSRVPTLFKWSIGLAIVSFTAYAAYSYMDHIKSCITSKA
nr:probable flavin-containing monoamine oxidase A [Ciona intestinalis]|eukprot:XP_002123175.1 probable flavin-containing monoamine oxidase A [Ciona intestinalis]